MTSAAGSAAHALTAQEFHDLPAEDRLWTELIAGEVCAVSPANFEHGMVAAALVRALHTFVEASGLGVVVSSETGFTIGRDPDTVRAPDAAFVSSERVPSPGSRRGFVELAPDLVAEVVSPRDHASYVLAKALAWLDAGSQIVWVLDPALRSAIVHRRDGVARIVRGPDGELDGEDVLPGLRIALRDLFG